MIWISFRMVGPTMALRLSSIRSCLLGARRLNPLPLVKVLKRNWEGQIWGCICRDASTCQRAQPFSMVAVSCPLAWSNQRRSPKFLGEFFSDIFSGLNLVYWLGHPGQTRRYLRWIWQTMSGKMWPSTVTKQLSSVAWLAGVVARHSNSINNPTF